MQLKNQKDFLCGLLFMALGVGFGWSASHHTVGTAHAMGPGYFPLLAGALLTVLGGLLVFKALVFETEDGGRLRGWAWRPLLGIVLACLAFGVLVNGVAVLALPPMGLVVSVLVLCVLAASATSTLRWKEVLLLSLVLTASSYLACIVLFKLQLAVWPAAGPV